MEFHILASGSKGNCVFIYDNNQGIVIDCGISRKQFVYKLSKLGYCEDDVDIVLLTHDHWDHKKNINIFDKDKTFCSEGCIEDISDDHVLIPYQEYKMGNITITPLTISHDATNPLAYVIKGSETLLYMTDTGYITRKNMKYMEDLNYYVIESNHDIEMLMNTKRPYFLIQRILNDRGHLNNEYSAKTMCEVMGKSTKEIVLAHLSAEANTPELAISTYRRVFNEHGIDFDNIKVASQVDIISGGNYNVD